MMVLEALIQFLTGTSPFSFELQCFWMAFQGAMAVSNGPNKDRTMHWFHAFCVSVICGYGGALLAPLWMGRPAAILSNDLGSASCIVCFIIVNYLPFGIGHKVGNSFPVTLVTTMFAQLFRTMGLVKFVAIAYEAFKDTPSGYYPTPVFGPILFATLLGNMGSFFLKGFHGHLEQGMPWPFQNGLFCATFYHFFVNDQKGFIGNALRSAVHSVPVIQSGVSDATFGVLFVSIFMQITGVLQMPQLLGPMFSPFNVIHGILEFVVSIFNGSKITKLEQLESDTTFVPNGQTNGAVTDYTKKKRNRPKNKKKEL